MPIGHKRRLFCLAIAWAALSITPAVAPAEPGTKIDFVSNGIGVPPADFEFWQTGRGEIGDWTVIRDATAAAGASIEQFNASPADDHFSLAIYKPISVKNVEVGAHLKVVRGTMRSAGVAVRLVNSDNYYVVRISALEERIDLLRVVDAKPERIAGTEAVIVRHRWHTLGIRVVDDRLTVSLDGKPLFTAFDRTFLRDGRIALWAEEDGITRFEEINIAALPLSNGD